MSKKIFIPALIITIVSIIIFSIPGSKELFSYSGLKFINGEIWRLITFPFTHISIAHLIENLLALGVAALFAREVELPAKYFLLLFLGTGILVAIFQSLIFPLLIIAGASLGIYGILGGVSMKGSHLIPRKVLITLLGLSVFVKFFYDLFTCSDCLTGKLYIQTALHFSGFLTGLAIFYPISRKKIRVLTGDLYGKG